MELYEKIYNKIYKKSVLESVVVNLQKLNEKIGKSKKLSEEKLEDAVDKNVTNTMLKDLLIDEIHKGNLNVFESKEILNLISKVQEMTNQARIVNISIALPLTEPDIKEIADQLEKKLKKKIIVDIKVDPNLIGGIILKQDKYIVDSSLKSHLKDYENEWIKTIRKGHRQEEN